MPSIQNATLAEKWNSAGTIRWSEITSNSRCCLVKYYPHLCNVMTEKIPMMQFLGTELSQNILHLSIIGVGYYLHLDLSFVLISTCITFQVQDWNTPTQQMILMEFSVYIPITRNHVSWHDRGLENQHWTTWYYTLIINIGPDHLVSIL